ncbi:hypothetical protein IAT40_000608 [Kwoniella sp. CBS 6097]
MSTLHPAPTRSEALIALSQDISALLALSYETAASTLHDKYHASLGFWGLGEWIRDRRDRTRKWESGRGYAVVVVGANEPTGQSLTLHLAKSGYTVFPFIPLPSPESDSVFDADSLPTSDALSHLLLTWSSVQKRLRAKYPRHCGQVVPVIVDPDNIAQDLPSAQRGDLKKSSSASSEAESSSSSASSSRIRTSSPTHTPTSTPTKRGKAKKQGAGYQRGGSLPPEGVHGGSTKWRGRFGHAGETVRAYCRENNLYLVAIVCVPQQAKKMPKSYFPTNSPSDNDDDDDDDVGQNRSEKEEEVSPASRARQLRDDWEGIAKITMGPRNVYTTTMDAITPAFPPVNVKSDVQLPSPWPFKPDNSTMSTSSSTSTRSGVPYAHYANPYEMIGLSPYALTLTDESTLASLYRSNVIDPLSVIKELTEFMSFTHAIGKGRARVILINGTEGGITHGAGSGGGAGGGGGVPGVVRETRDAMKVVNAARREACGIMRAELRELGIGVCEVVVGPMGARSRSGGGPARHLRQSSEDSLIGHDQVSKISPSDKSENSITPNRLSVLFRQYVSSTWRLTDTCKFSPFISFSLSLPSSNVFVAREDIVQSRYEALSTLWAVDDALLFSSVRRAIEDRYPRTKHHAGLTPVLDDLASNVPGGGFVKRYVEWVGRGVLGWRVWDWVAGDGGRF